MRCSVFIATSLDGFIAREDGCIDWLEAASATLPEGEDCGYGSFIADVDNVILGRRTFEQVLTFPAWPFGERPVHVLSPSLAAIPEGAPATTHLWRDSPAALAAHLDGRGMRRAYVDGGEAIRSFLRAGLIDDLTVTTVPVLLGRGRALFGPVDFDVPLALVASERFANGFVQATYELRGRSTR